MIRASKGDFGKRRRLYGNKAGKNGDFCQTMEWPEEIEINRVNRAIEEHQRKIREAKASANIR